MGTDLAIKTENTSIDEWGMMREQANVLVKTGFLPTSINTPEKAMAIMLTGKELGIPPMQALRGVDVIQGKPTIKPEMMLALCVKRIPGFKYCFGICDNESATFTCSRPEMLEPYTNTFTMKDAITAGLSEKDIWKKYPGNMLRWRALGNALHIVASDVLVGVYTPEEMGAVVDDTGGVIVDVTQSAAVANGEPIIFCEDCGQQVVAGTLGKKHYTAAEVASNPEVERAYLGG